ncbi:MAG: 1-deoxy-D-xylulose-5-phosphate synthase [Arsenophonus sp.]|nr:MAG: 1-deoxy-D-xylulose-5-phosphate synthase [Arsenophonus sp.]
MNIKKDCYPILSLINNPKDLRRLSKIKLPQLCNELRFFLLKSVSKSSGHFASGLGVIELTVALHYIYNTPFDNIIWDVGHQAYPHKILTERKKKIYTIRKDHGLHPFPCREESIYDTFSVGHSSTSISAGLGMAVAAEYEKKNRKTICVIGDGGITSGMAYEAMNHAGYINKDILVILNDNQMSISENVGYLSKYLNKLFFSYFNLNSKNKKTKFLFKIPFIKRFFEKALSSNTIFEALGFNYIGIIDGHDIKKLLKILSKIKKIKGPHFLHLITKKGKGYKPAEEDPISWHAVPKFNLKSFVFPKKTNKKTFSEFFGKWLCQQASQDKKLIVITPAMREGSCLVKFSELYPRQFFDVAIAEQHAITFAAGLSIGGYNPIISIYSSFLQRAYDQVIHDIAIQKIPVLFAIDRSGIVGADGRTHQGVFDISFLRCIPNIIIMVPSDENEFRQMLYTGYFYKKFPVFIRYPKREIFGVNLKKISSIPIGKARILRIGQKISILNFGPLVFEAIKAAKILNATVIDMRFVKPLDQKIILETVKKHEFLVTLEENSIYGGAGSAVNEFLMKKKCLIPILNLGIPDYYIDHGNQNKILSKLGLDSQGILNSIKEYVNSI